MRSSVLYWLISLFLLLSIYASDVSGSYRVEMTLYSYDNPSGRCHGCQPNSTHPGCCDDTIVHVRPLHQECHASFTCDTLIGYNYCHRNIDNSLDCVNVTFRRFYSSNTNSFDFPISGLDNPLVAEGDEPWDDITFLLIARDCADIANRCVSSKLIDYASINVDIPVGTSSPQQVYTGIYDIAQFNLSYEVMCAEDFYGGDCVTFCGNFESCEECGLPGFTGEFCQLPRQECRETYCSGNGWCTEGSTTCECDHGFTGSQCQFDGCTGVDCGTHGRCKSSGSGFMCVCDLGYTGELCTFPVGITAGCVVGACFVLLIIVVSVTVICKRQKAKRSRVTIPPNSSTSVPMTTMQAPPTYPPEKLNEYSAAGAPPSYEKSSSIHDPSLYPTQPYPPQAQYPAYTQDPAYPYPQVQTTPLNDPYPTGASSQYLTAYPAYSAHPGAPSIPPHL